MIQFLQNVFCDISKPQYEFKVLVINLIKMKSTTVHDLHIEQ